MMKIFPLITGALCANSHPGSYTGQDAFNNMLPVIERTSHDLLDEPRDLKVQDEQCRKQFIGKRSQVCSGHHSGESNNGNGMCRKWADEPDKHGQRDEHVGLYARPTNSCGGGTKDLEISDRKYVLRRLTPTECARLQGFPDWWCDGANGSDTAMYRMWGNGIALPCAVDVLGRIAKELTPEIKQE